MNLYAFFSSFKMWNIIRTRNVICINHRFIPVHTLFPTNLYLSLLYMYTKSFLWKSTSQVLFFCQLTGLPSNVHSTNPDLSCFHFDRTFTGSFAKTFITGKTDLHVYNWNAKLLSLFPNQLFNNIKHLRAAVNADWSGCKNTRRSSSAYVSTIDSTSPTFQQSERQSVASLPSEKLKYVALSTSAKAVIWIR